MNRFALAAPLVVAVFGATSFAATIPVVEDVMTSGFFQGSNSVRGYPGDSRPVLRVGSDNAFDTGAETVYLTFDPAHFAAYTGPVPKAILQVESVAGGIGADATAENPFAMSAHAVSANPLTAITDDTNPGGPTAWNAFFANNILPADPTAITRVTGFGTLQFDITSIVNDWISGVNSVFAIALTGKHDTLSDGNVLHGLRNNNDTTVLGSSFISIVPEPGTMLLAGVGIALALGMRRRDRLEITINRKNLTQRESKP